MTEATVGIETAAGTMNAFRTDPQNNPKGAIVVVQEAYGVTGHIENICRRLSSEGWLAVAPELFHRNGSSVQSSYDDMQRAMDLIKSLTSDGVTQDLDATLSYLLDKDFDEANCGLVGFCMGGSIAYSGAVRYPLGAAVTFYGGGIKEGRFGFPSMLSSADNLQTPWLGLFGDKDTSIPAEQVEQLRVATKNAAVPTEIVRYPEAGHAFNNDERPDRYHETSARDAWRRALRWFDEYAGR